MARLTSLFLFLFLSLLVTQATTSPTRFTSAQFVEIEKLRARGVPEAKIYAQITHSPSPSKRAENLAFASLEWRVLARVGLAADVIESFIAGTEAKVKRVVAVAGSRDGRKEEAERHGEEVGIEVRGRMGRGGLKVRRV